MKEMFVVSDIHGMYAEFIELLKYWNSQTQTLVILGDMVDRGQDSLKVVQHIMALSKEHDVIVVKGNHDQMLLDFIDEPYEYGYQYQASGGEHTMRSFAQDDRIILYSFQERAERIAQLCKSEIFFLRKAVPYWTNGNVLFTHAGFSPYVKNWRETTLDDFMWVREHYRYPNKSGYVNVFGHTPTRLIDKDESNDIWISTDKTYVAIDGSCAYGGQLNGLVINERGKVVETYSIQSNKKLEK